MSNSGIPAKALKLHNECRALHGASELTWSTLIEKAAAEYATHLASENLPLKSSPNSAWGQNLYELRNPGGVPVDAEVAVEKAIASWYGNRKHFDLGTDSYPTVSPSGPGLSFSQLVWKSTEKLGIAVALSSDKLRAVVVAFYDPPGNVSAEFKFNVQERSSNDQASTAISSIANAITNLNVGGNPAGTNSTTASKEITLKISISADSAAEESSSTISTSSTATATSSQTEHSKTTTTTETTRKDIGTQGQGHDKQGQSVTSNGGNGQPILCTFNANPAELAALELHNQLRKKHGVPPVRLDQKLSEAATIHANALLGGNKALGHVGLVGLGQNVFRQTGLPPPSSDKTKDPNATWVAEAVNSWYSHGKDYNWDHPNLSGKYAGLFTQLIWKDVERIGVAVAKRADLTVVVCLYSEHGNVSDEQKQKENVFKAV